MKIVNLKIYRSYPNDSRSERKLIHSTDIEISSEKPLNASRASKIIGRELPDFKYPCSVSVIKTEHGWEAIRIVEHSEKCHYHYVWEYAVISEVAVGINT